MRFFGEPDPPGTQAFSFDSTMPIEASSGSTSLIPSSCFQRLLPDSATGPSIPWDANLDSGHQEIDTTSSAAVPTLQGRLGGAKDFAVSLVRHSKTIERNDRDISWKLNLPTVEDIIESLESLLPVTNIPLLGDFGLAIAGEAACPSSNLSKTLLYSFANNFAGLRDVPRSSLMQLLREQHEMRTQLFEVIKRGPSGVAKSLADNFFRAAVEGGDVDAVATIIHHTRNNPRIAIDPNEIVCDFEGDPYTPIELAARFRNTQLVRTLIASRADPNKTYGQERDKYWEKGALALALGHWLNGSEYPFKPSPAGEPKPVDLDLLWLLLECGAEVCVDMAINAMRPGPENTVIAEGLISRIPASDHRICFENEWLALSVIHYLENSAASRIIKRFFSHCSESPDCGTCASENPRAVEKMLCHAARRANLELSEFLAQHTAQLQSALAAAVRAGSDKLIGFLLGKGACVDGKVESWQSGNLWGRWIDLFDEDGYDRPKSSTFVEYVITPIRTPLAEAIRARNDHLIGTFEKLGALDRLHERYHFIPAAVAAAEVGNILYLKKVLSHAPRVLGDSSLTLPLAIAIRNDKTTAALLLLDAGAIPYDVLSRRQYGNAFTNALERRNKRIVDSMLDNDLDLLPGVQNEYLEIAATWCDLEVITGLLQLGAHINSGMKTTALGAAVRSRNKALVVQLLDLGADPQAEGKEDGTTPLRAAMEIGDYEMVRFLISRGASPADYSAFLYAIQHHDQRGYELLLSMFESHHRQGLPGFGGHLLAKAIQLNDQTLFDRLLEARADVNSWSMSREPSRMASYEYSSAIIYRILGFAIRHGKEGNYQLVGRLLERGAETNMIVAEDRQPRRPGPFLILETPLILAIRTKNSSIVSLLLEYGADLNRPACRGVKRTPLQAACETGSHKMVELLLQMGALVNAPAAARYGGTALQMAAKSGSLRIVKLLLDHHADPLMPGSKVEGRTAFEAAAENGCSDILGVLWNAVLPYGFSMEECQRAKMFARGKGHRGCVGILDFLSGRSSHSSWND